MKIYYSPCKSEQDTQITVIDDNTLTIDGEEFVFDADSVEWDNITEITGGKILEAHRTDGILYVKVLRFYSDVCPWDSGTYTEAQS